MKIIVDAMGGDHAPQAIVQGALEAHKTHGVEILLVGRAAEVLRAVEACGERTLPAGVEIRDAAEVVEIMDNPATAFKVKKDSSLTVGMNLLKEGAGDAFVSAGSTGALLAGATLLVKRIHGIRRAKGDTLRHEAYELLRSAGEAGRIHFIGNLEAGDAMMGGADVLVADGFTGNVMLKSLEGTAKFLLGELKKTMLSSTKNKMAAAMLKGDLANMKRLLDPSEIGGTAFLGISKPVIKAHGSSNARAISNAILRAKEYVESGLIADIERDIDLMKVERKQEKM